MWEESQELGKGTKRRLQEYITITGRHNEEVRQEEDLLQAVVQGERLQVGGRGETVTVNVGKPPEADQLGNIHDEGRAQEKPC